MSQKSSVPQLAISLSQALMSDKKRCCLVRLEQHVTELYGIAHA